MFRIAICEDRLEEQNILVEKAKIYFEKKNLRYLIQTYSSGNAIFAEIEDKTAVFDLILMDIHLGTTNGFETAVKIREIDPEVPIAFVTACRDYAVESYDVDAVAYLLKPLQEDKLYALLSKMTRAEKPRSLTVKQRGRIRNLDYRDIFYLESSGHKVVIHLVDRSEETVYAKLDTLECCLEDERFVRCHKSFLVNMDYVQGIQKDFEMEDGVIVPIRTHGRKEIIKRYESYFTKKQKKDAKM
ncbi:MAG: response regulator transcription factor [Firmicutes bacterium]|nr:response regulator transcription factor [Bacillota bacterium]